MKLEGLDTINLVKVREYTNTPFTTLAKVVGVSEEEYKSLESGKDTMTVDQFRSLKLFYKLPTDYLMGRLFTGITVTNGLYQFLLKLEESGILYQVNGYEKLSAILLKELVDEKERVCK